METVHEAVLIIIKQLTR